MSQPAKFNEVLDAVEHLPPDQQADLPEVVRRRLAEPGRQRVLDDIREARAEMNTGAAKPSSVDDIMREIERDVTEVLEGGKARYPAP
jgi:hypothetical protein